MNYTKKNWLFVLAISLAHSVSGLSQEDAGLPQPTKKWVYEFYVSGIVSTLDTEKLDLTMTLMVGIYSCTTDFKTKRVVVTCVPGIGYNDLKIIVKAVGFVAEENYFSFKIRDNISKE